ncbi:hypothetical protein [Paraburkholderia sp. HD33-4]|uniref:hypothetical protein n=1 Tax=Paraburkholderia sp. HD33-4 TaxID=2883242 RepID=UPI001F46BF34|nr:hypothetical protein [Paraburkholderia sp. HD33-4]
MFEAMSSVPKEALRKILSDNLWQINRRDYPPVVAFAGMDKLLETEESYVNDELARALILREGARALIGCASNQLVLLRSFQ